MYVTAEKVFNVVVMTMIIVAVVTSLGTTITLVSIDKRLTQIEKNQTELVQVLVEANFIPEELRVYNQ